jgi:hypothetical protein
VFREWRWPGGCGGRRSLQTELLNFANLSFSLVGVRGDGEDGGGGIQDEADGLAFGLPAGQDDDPRSVGLRPGLLGEGEVLPGPLVEPGQHHVGLVDLVAGDAEVLAHRPEVGAPAGAACRNPFWIAPCGPAKYVAYLTYLPGSALLE